MKWNENDCLHFVTLWNLTNMSYLKVLNHTIILVSTLFRLLTLYSFCSLLFLFFSFFTGVSGLATVLVIGNRKGFGSERFEPHNILVTFMGMSMLWVGWYGFNAGTYGWARMKSSWWSAVHVVPSWPSQRDHKKEIDQYLLLCRTNLIPHITAFLTHG